MERERNCIKPRAGDDDLWIKIWEDLLRLAARDIVVEVEHVKAHRTKKDKKEMSQSEKFVAEGYEKADELAKAGAMLDEGFMAEARASAREGRGVRRALQYAASFHCLVEERKDCEELKQKKSGISLTKRVRTRSIVRSGVQKRKSIGV